MTSIPVPADPVQASGALCAPFVRALGVSGASISISGMGNRQSTICISGPTAAQLDMLQLELGEGPRWEALASRDRVLCPDLSDIDDPRWPFFLSAARGLGIGAVFCFPMLLGAALVGVVDLCCTSPRAADPEFLSRATLMAGRVASAAVQLALHSAEDHRSPESVRSPALRREVHQATGMIVSQLEISPTEAFSRIQAYAFGNGRPLEDVAHDIVSRVLVFTQTPD